MRGASADALLSGRPSLVHHNEHSERHRGHSGVPPAAAQALHSIDVSKEGASRAAAQVPSCPLCLSSWAL